MPLKPPPPAKKYLPFHFEVGRATSNSNGGLRQVLDAAQHFAIFRYRTCGRNDRDGGDRRVFQCQFRQARAVRRLGGSRTNPKANEKRSERDEDEASPPCGQGGVVKGQESFYFFMRRHGIRLPSLRFVSPQVRTVAHLVSCDLRTS